MPAPPMDGAGGEPWPGYIYPGGQAPAACSGRGERHRRRVTAVRVVRRPRGGAGVGTREATRRQRRRPGSRPGSSVVRAEVLVAVVVRSQPRAGGTRGGAGQWRLAACAGLTRAGAPRVPGYCVPGLACSLHGSVIRLGSLPSSLPAVHPPNATRPKDRIGTPTPTCTHLRRRSGTGRPAHVASSDAYTCMCMHGSLRQTSRSNMGDGRCTHARGQFAFCSSTGRGGGQDGLDRARNEYAWRPTDTILPCTFTEYYM
jgi:hypothetical protein